MISQIHPNMTELWDLFFRMTQTATCSCQSFDLPPDVSLGHDALQTVTELKKCFCLEIKINEMSVWLHHQLVPQKRQHKSKFTFNRRLALKMDLKPNWRYSKSNGMRDIMSAWWVETQVRSLSSSYRYKIKKFKLHYRESFGFSVVLLGHHSVFLKEIKWHLSFCYIINLFHSQ